MVCKDVGESNSDIAGIGIIVTFAAQAGISIILSIWSYNLGLRNEEAHPKTKCGRSIIDRILSNISDVQTLNGIALLIAAINQHKSLSLYHYHIIYDTVNFTAISFCAALVNVFGHDEERKTSRYLSIAVFSILYLIFSIFFGKSLEKWDDSVPGRCYMTERIARADARHPYVDRIYLGITCFYVFAALETVVIASLSTWKYFRYSAISIALLQYPLHLYMLVALRKSNMKLLSGDQEDSWGFGQIVALVMLGSTVVECLRGLKDYSNSRPRPHAESIQLLEKEEESKQESGRQSFASNTLPGGWQNL